MVSRCPPRAIPWVLLVGLVLPSFLRAQPEPAPLTPNIILFLADDLGWKDVGFNGSEISTPHLDQLAAEGGVLRQLYVQPVCSPTRASLLTGRYPIRYGLQSGVIRPWVSHGLPLRERLLPQALKAAGYVTAICGKWHLGHGARELLPTARGFDHQYGHLLGAIDYFRHTRLGGRDWRRDDQPLEEEGYTTELLAAEAVRLIQAHDARRPLFLYLPFNAPHTPLQVPDRFRERYAHLSRPRRRTFAAMVTCMDEAIGKVMAALKARGFDRPTLVLFASDNGGPTGSGADNGPWRGGKGSLYEGGVRVPGLVWCPGQIPAGQEISGLLHIVDVHATLLQVAGIREDPPLPLDGLAAWPTLAQGKPSPRTELLHNVSPASSALRRDGWKLVVTRTRRSEPAGQEEGGMQVELFHLPDDPGEQKNLAGTHPETVKELQERLDRYASEAAPPLASPPRPPPGFAAPGWWGPSAPPPGQGR